MCAWGPKTSVHLPQQWAVSFNFWFIYHNSDSNHFGQHNFELNLESDVLNCLILYLSFSTCIHRQIDNNLILVSFKFVSHLVPVAYDDWSNANQYKFICFDVIALLICVVIHSQLPKKKLFMEIVSKKLFISDCNSTGYFHCWNVI